VDAQPDRFLAVHQGRVFPDSLIWQISGVFFHGTGTWAEKNSSGINFTGFSASLPQGLHIDPTPLTGRHDAYFVGGVAH